MFDTPIGRRDALRRLSLVFGGIATAPLASGLLSGCRTPSQDSLADYTYAVLSPDQQQQVAALVDQIIPATETAGASEVGVPQFIDKMLAEWYHPDERERFLAGLAEVNSRAEGGSFAALTPDAQGALVAAMDAEAYGGPAPEPVEADDDVAEAAQAGTAAADEEAENEVAGMQGDLAEAEADTSGSATLTTGEGTVETESASDEGPPFFRQLKELTLAGYYTSEVGATQELQWEAAPGRYESDLPLSDVGRAWA